MAGLYQVLNKQVPVPVPVVQVPVQVPVLGKQVQVQVPVLSQFLALGYATQSIRCSLSEI